jgi:hypothetical protein
LPGRRTNTARPGLAQLVAKAPTEFNSPVAAIRAGKAGILAVWRDWPFVSLIENFRYRWAERALGTNPRCPFGIEIENRRVPPTPNRCDRHGRLRVNAVSTGDNLRPDRSTFGGETVENPGERFRRKEADQEDKSLAA